ILAAESQEWRSGDSLPPRLCENWQLVYLVSGTAEEICDGERQTLSQGQLLFHEPGRTIAMKVPGSIPPEVLRVEFWCDGTAIARFLGGRIRADGVERAHLARIGTLLEEVFLPPTAPGQPPPLRPEPPFGAHQLLCNALETLLITLARRLQGGRQPTVHAKKERARAVLLSSARDYFLAHLDCELTVNEVCAACGCSREALQEAFRTGEKTGPMQYFAALRLERAKELLAHDAGPGETARLLGYSTGTYFSRCFKKATGQTPLAYRRQIHAMNEKDK
ncbi:MAG: AraC family transcriptional regulator, partial [Gemmiger sp.]|nr:AraC family transcriptional regulator [Gemmiger sp.]